MHRTLSRKILLTGGLSFLLGAAATSLCLHRARANGIPAMNALHYAGTLAEKGVPVDGPRDITVVVWKDGQSTDASNQLCITQAGSTPISAGRFEVPLADQCTTALANNPESWAEVQVAGVSYGRQKIGAVPYAIISSAVDGAVKSTAITPHYAADGSLGRGDGGSSIYNDGSVQKALVITGNNSLGGNQRIVLYDDVGVNKALTVGGALAVGGNATITGDLTAHSEAPQYVSAWKAIDRYTSGDVQFPHGLGAIPSRFLVQECGAIDSANNCTTPMLVNGYHDAGVDVNPNSISADATNVTVPVVSSWWVWNYYTVAKGWTCPATYNCDTGYYRVLAWR